MKKFSLLILLGFGLLMMPRSGFAKTYCFVGVSGGSIYFELNSGKVDVKPFAGYVFVEALECHVSQWGAIITDNAGIQWITTNSSHDPASGCLSVQAYGSGNVESGFDINYDNGQDGTIDGSFFISPINCNQVPVPFINEGAVAKPTDYSFGGLSKKSE